MQRYAFRIFRFEYPMPPLEGGQSQMMRFTEHFLGLITDFPGVQVFAPPLAVDLSFR